MNLTAPSGRRPTPLRGLIVPLLFAAALAFASCRGGGGFGAGGVDPNASVVSLSVAQLDTFAATDSLVSLSGYILEQEENRRAILFRDATGLIQVSLPEALPPLAGKRIHLVGRVRRSGDRPLQFDALWWLYDSTGVSIRSSS